LFTGLIEEQGVILRISGSGDGTNLVIKAKEVLRDLEIGDSIAVNGPCLTVTALDQDSFTVWVMPETLKKSNLKDLSTGHRVNLERALTLSSRLGGHMVSGHVDAVITLTGRQKQGGSLIIFFDVPEDLLCYIIPKGSVSLDGVSLTVVDVNDHGFSVGMIPHTAAQTALGRKGSGSSVNLEVDMIGKYVEKLMGSHYKGEQDQTEKISISLLQEKGYL